MNPIAITAIGMSSSLGDVQTACAAARCGMARVAPLPGRVALGDEQTEVEISVSPVGSAAGFIQNAAWVAMAVDSVRDAVAYGRLPPPADRFWADVPLVWALPVMDYERFGWPERETPDLLRRSCSALLRSLLGLPAAATATADVFVAAGHAGVAAAIEVASTLLQARCERVLLLATDSWLDARSLSLLEGQQRLKTPDRAVGLIPGEAGVCLLLEDAGAARRRKAEVAALLAGAALRPPPGAIDRADPRRWRSGQVIPLAKAVAATLEAASAGALRGDAVVDLNGEDWRARVWGTALSLLARKAELRAVVPAVSFGDTGAASAAIGICIAARSFARRYASAPATLISSVSEDGQVGAVRVVAP